MFISLNVEPETREAVVAALDALRIEFEARGVPVRDGDWGYRILVVEDLDGNQLFFNYPNEPGRDPGGATVSSSPVARTRPSNWEFA